MTPRQAWHAIREGPAWQGNASTELGTRFEAPIINWAAERLGHDPEAIERQVFFIGEDDRFGATLDARLGTRWAIEAKVITGARAEHLGEEGTDQLPLDVLAQVWVQMYVAQWMDTCYVAVLTTSYDFLAMRLYCVRRPSDEQMRALIEPLGAWYDRHIAGGEEPDDLGIIPMEFLRARRLTRATVAIPERLFIEYATAKKAKELAENREREARARIETAIAKASPEGMIADLAIGGPWSATYREQRSTPSVNHDLLRADGVWDRYCTQGTHRRLTIKEPRCEQLSERTRASDPETGIAPRPESGADGAVRECPSALGEAESADSQRAAKECHPRPNDSGVSDDAASPAEAGAIEHPRMLRT
jgi:hypothetical protein